MKKQTIISVLVILLIFGVLNSCSKKAQQSEAEPNSDSEIVIQAYEDPIPEAAPAVEIQAPKEVKQTVKQEVKKTVETAVKQAATVPAAVEKTVTKEAQKVEAKAKEVAADAEGKWETLESLTSGTLESATDTIKTTGKKLDAETLSTTPLPKDAAKAVNSANEALKAFGDFGF
jgi:hypothetical protein